MHFKISSFFLIFASILFAMPSKGIEDAKTYHNNSSLQWQIALETIDMVSWNGLEKVLDLGCGDGKITALLSSKARSVLGVDISPAMIDFACCHYPETDYPNLSFQVGDAAEISFENEFDRVVSFSTLHWVLDQERALRAIHRSLVPGGRVCLQIYGKGLMNVTSIAEELIQTSEWASYFPLYQKQRIFFSEEEYRNLLERAGFNQIEVAGSWKAISFKNRQELIDFSKPVLNFIQHLPLALQQKFVEDLVDKIVLRAGTSDDGTITYRIFSLQALAVKCNGS